MSSPIYKHRVPPPTVAYSPLSSNKFTTARIETDRLANIISKSGKKTFESQMKLVKKLIEAFADKKDVDIVPSNIQLQSESENEEHEESFSSSSSSLPPISRPKSTEIVKIETKSETIHSDILNIRPQHRERFSGRPSTQTAIGKTRRRPKPSLRLRKNKNLVIVPIGPSAAKKAKTEITIDDDVCET